MDVDTKVAYISFNNKSNNYLIIVVLDLILAIYIYLFISISFKRIFSENVYDSFGRKEKSFYGTERIE